MIADTNRRALRSALPWLFVGYLLLAFSIGFWLLEYVTPASFVADVDRGAAVCGIAGSACIGVGLVQLARALVSAQPSPALLLAFVFWTIELALRIRAFGTTAQSAPSGAGADGAALALPPVDPLAGVRLLLACATMIALATGMIWIFGSRMPRAPRDIWRNTRRAFAAQICGYLSLYVAAWWHARSARVVFEEVAASIPLGWAIAWVLFAGPYALLFLALKATVRHANRRQSAAEILSS